MACTISSRVLITNSCSVLLRPARRGGPPARTRRDGDLGRPAARIPTVQPRSRASSTPSMVLLAECEFAARRAVWSAVEKLDVERGVARTLPALFIERHDRRDPGESPSPDAGDCPAAQPPADARAEAAESRSCSVEPGFVVAKFRCPVQAPTDFAYPGPLGVVLSELCPRYARRPTCASWE
jgi:hypothetical protein